MSKNNNFKLQVLVREQGLLKEVYVDNEKDYKKILGDHYYIENEKTVLIDKDKRNIRPYVRFLANNGKEKFRHVLIVLIFFISIVSLISSITTLSAVFGISKGNINNNAGSIEKKVSQKISSERIPGITDSEEAKDRGKGSGIY